MTLGSELALSSSCVETSCVIPGVHVGFMFGFFCQAGVSRWVDRLFFYIGVFPAFGEGGVPV